MISSSQVIFPFHSTRILFPVACLFLASCIGIHAAPAPSQAKSEATGAARVKVVPAKLFSFRDPFWPVGYVPLALRPPPPPPPVKRPKKAPEPSLSKKVPAKAVVVKPKPVVVSPDWKKALGLLRITGYAETAGRKSCVINDKTVSEGEVVSVQFDKFKYSWRVDQIAPVKSQMRFTRQGAVLLKK